MSQLSLFEPERRARQPAEPNPAFIRKHLNRALNLVRAAELMPWPQGEAQAWQEQFPILAKALPSAEGAELTDAFERELSRLGHDMEPPQAERLAT